MLDHALFMPLISKSFSKEAKIISRPSLGLIFTCIFCSDEPSFILASDYGAVTGTPHGPSSARTSDPAQINF